MLGFIKENGEKDNVNEHKIEDNYENVIIESGIIDLDSPY